VQLDFYDPPAQTLTPTTSIVVRMQRGQERQVLAMASTIAARARELDPQVLISNIAPLDQVVDREMAPWRFSAWVFTLFAALAFTLSVVGLFSLVSLDVANRRQELAIRMAIGASPQSLVRSVFASAGTRAAIGITIGLAGAVAATRSLQGLLFGITLGDRLTYAAVTMLVLAVVAVASYVPARRAAGIDPISLLRR
jgi:ABC-type antimicrobial peptide transport system permease subunit